MGPPSRTPRAELASRPGEGVPTYSGCKTEKAQGPTAVRNGRDTSRRTYVPTPETRCRAGVRDLCAAVATDAFLPLAL